MKLRVIPTVVVVVLTSLALFGGWFIYRNVAVENPLKNRINDIAGVEDLKMSIGQSRVDLRVQLAPGTDLRTVYQQIWDKGSSVIGDREVELTIVNPLVPKLENIWSEALFDVAEAMEARHYSSIPAAMKQLENRHPGLATTTEMDEDNVYIRLTFGSEDKYVLLPRMPQMLGVWTE